MESTDNFPIYYLSSYLNDPKCKEWYSNFVDDLDIDRQSLKSGIKKINRQKYFEYCCNNGHLITAKWLYHFGDISFNHKDISNREFYESEILRITQKNVENQINIITIENCDVFINSCLNGHLNIVIWLHSIGIINPKRFNCCAFRFSCRNGHLLVAKWLFEEGYADIHANNDEAFRFSCQFDHLETAKWIYEVGGGKLNIHAKNDDALVSSCKNGLLEVVKWLCSLDKFNSKSINVGNAFIYSCMNGHLELAKWLYNNNIIDIRLCGKTAFINSLYNDKIHVVMWLFNLNFLTDPYDLFGKYGQPEFLNFLSNTGIYYGNNY